MKGFFQKYETKIILIAGFILVAAISFEAGFLQGKKAPDKPLVIEKQAESTKIEPPAASSDGVAKDTPAENNLTTGQNSASSEMPKNCAYVGSKNSNKYHLPTCQYAKKIKPENLVCFTSIEDATAKNYLPDKSCIK